MATTRWILCMVLVAWVTPFLMADDTPQGGRRPLQWGVYQMYWGRSRYASILSRQIEPLASTPDYVMFYRDLSGSFPKEGIDAIEALGATPIVSLELWKWHDSKPKYLPKIARGDYDDHFRRWAQDAKKDGRRILLRFGFEFNGDWFSWSGDPDSFVRAWRRVRSIFDETGASNVKWVWAANVTSHPGGPENDMERYYPGDKLVDWVAVDGYNWGDHYKVWHHWSSFDEIFGSVLERFSRRHTSKPVMISEFGCPEGRPGQKAVWIQNAYAAALRHPQIKALIWFNLDKRREGELNFRLDSSPESLKAFNETFAAPHHHKAE